MWTFTNHSRRLALSLVQLESVISERTAELQNLSQRLLKVQDEERRRLARDLHDSTGQTLAALKISVTCLQEKCKQDPSILAISSEVAGLADRAIVEIRTMSYLLHPPLLDEVGFACAAEWYVDGFAKRSGIRVHLNLATGCERLPTGIEMALFRVLQESLTNVHRHSGASQVSVRFQNQTGTCNPGNTGFRARHTNWPVGATSREARKPASVLPECASACMNSTASLKSNRTALERMCGQ